jgi:hypothetical protein
MATAYLYYALPPMNDNNGSKEEWNGAEAGNYNLRRKKKKKKKVELTIEGLNLGKRVSEWVVDYC